MINTFRLHLTVLGSVINTFRLHLTVLELKGTEACAQRSEVENDSSLVKSFLALELHLKGRPSTILRALNCQESAQHL